MRPILASLLCLVFNLLNPNGWETCVTRTKPTLAIRKNQTNKEPAHINDCHLPVDSGSCTNTADNKEETRYYYSAKNLKCTEFPYSGCKGNANNFKTMEDCERKCGKPYSDSELRANILRARAQSKCWYKNKTYSPGDSIPPAADDGPCYVPCTCDGPFEDGFFKISCPHVECFKKWIKGCVQVYKEGGCCPTDYCPPPVGQVETIHKCKYKGNEYVEGQRIYLPRTEDYPCLSCSCNKNFKGVLTTEGGVCREFYCGFQLQKQSYIVNQCRPRAYPWVKDRARCCPFEWNCLDTIL